MTSTPAPTPADYVVIDEAAAPYSQGYTLHRTLRTSAGDKVRINIRRDSHAVQSWARAEVLNADMKWTTLADDAVVFWHPFTPYTSHKDEITGLLAEVADGLTRRALAILA